MPLLGQGSGSGGGVQLTAAGALVHDFEKRVHQNRGAITNTERTALVSLANVINAIGQDKFIFFYPFVGSSASSCAVNLIDGSYKITWSGTSTYGSSGVTSNGTTGYGNTGYNPSTAGLSTSSAACGFSVPTGTMGAVDGHALGSQASTGGRSGIVAGWLGTGTAVLCQIAGDNTVQSPSSGASTTLANVHGWCCNGDRVADYSENGGAIVAGDTQAGTYYNGNIFVCASNRGGAATGFLTTALSTAWLSTGLTDAQLQQLLAAIVTFETALGR